MGKKRAEGASSQNSKLPAQFWCYYCDTRHEDEYKLIQHQRSKHFLCRLCDPKAYGRNCLSLGGLVSHVRRSHRTELTEVPGAVAGRTSLEVEVSAMSGIPQAAMEAFEEQLATEMLQARCAPPSIDEMPPIPEEYEQEQEEPATTDTSELMERWKRAKRDKDWDRADSLRSELRSYGMDPEDTQKDDESVHTPLLPELAILANTLASQLTEQNSSLLGAAPEKPSKSATSDIKAFDRAKLAARLAAIGESSGLDTGDDQDAAASAAADARAAQEAQKKQQQQQPKISMSFFKKEELKPIEQPKPVSRVDKSAVEDLGFAVAARAAAAAQAAKLAAAAAALRPPPPPKPKKEAPTFRTKLLAMEDYVLLEYARDVGVNARELNQAMNSPDSKAIVVDMILDLEAIEQWTTVTFRPGKMGVKPGKDDGGWKYGKIKTVTSGSQCEALGVKPGWVFVTVDGERFKKSLLVSRIKGQQDYKVVFAKTPGPARARRTQPPLPPDDGARPPPQEAGGGRRKGRDRSRSPKGRGDRGDRHAQEELDDEEYSLSPEPRRGRGRGRDAPEDEGRGKKAKKRHRDDDQHDGHDDAHEEERPRKKDGDRRRDRGERKEGRGRRRDREELYDPEEEYNPETIAA